MPLFDISFIRLPDALSVDGSLWLHRAPIPEEEPIPGEEPNPDQEELPPHPDPELDDLVKRSSGLSPHTTVIQGSDKKEL
jgi:hypothetical protein